jgi:ACS family tartrate transporter-like MFS transporter
MSAFLDRVNVGFAKLQMMADLHLSNAVYGLGAGIFFVGYFLFEVPSNLILSRVGARLWIARIMVVWGFISLSMMGVKTATQFYALRFLLGAAEAGFFPGIIYYLTQWFPSRHRSRAIAVFVAAAVFSGAVGSPISGLLLQLDGALGLRGWRLLFLVEAIPSIVLGIVVLLRLPNGPREARWLFDDERRFIEETLASERKQAESESKVSLGQALTDPRVLTLSFVYLSNCMGGYALDFFQPTLVREAFVGATPSAIGFINALPAAGTILVMVLFGRLSDRAGDRRRYVAAANAWAGVGLLLASLPLPPWMALGALWIALSGRWSALAPFWGFATTLLTGTAAAGAIALVNSVGNLGGFAGPYLMGWLRDATGGYRIGLQLLSAMMLFGGLAIMTLRTIPPGSQPAAPLAR